MWKNILLCVMDENGMKMIMDELFREHSQQVLFCKKLKKRNRIQYIYVSLLWTICHMKYSNYTWIIILDFNFATFKPYKIWDYIKFNGT
jgi:hypothetical protein